MLDSDGDICELRLLTVSVFILYWYKTCRLSELPLLLLKLHIYCFKVLDIQKEGPIYLTRFIWSYECRHTDVNVLVGPLDATVV